MKTFIVDTETNALKGYTKLHNVVFRERLENGVSGNVTTFRRVDEDTKECQSFLQSIKGSTLVGHNILGFDLGVLTHFISGVLYSDFNWCDTLVLSKLLNYKQPNGHSLEAWGEYFGENKSLYEDFSVWSQALEDRCIVDTSINLRLYNFLQRFIKDPKWKAAIQLEHDTVLVCNQLHMDGFPFDIERAKALREHLFGVVLKLQESFNVVFPPKSVLIREINPVKTKTGSLNSKDFRWLKTEKETPLDLRPFSENSPFSLFEFQTFNPNSSTQRVERLNQAGWKPFNKTKGHIAALKDKDTTPEGKERLARFKQYGWTLDEDNLATLPEDAPEAARNLSQYILLSSRLSDLDEWIALYNANTGCIHPIINSIGSWTHRKSHQNPNCANIPSLFKNGKLQPYGAEFRELWKADNDEVLVGVDADSIQLRIFAHLCNDVRLIDAIEKGNKDDKTDVHSLNKSILGTICNSRDSAKTYIYALLLGAGMDKQASILGCSKAEALAGLARILDFYPGWKMLKDSQLKAEGRRGYFTGLDGRLVMTPSSHHVLAGHLQNGESVIMKRATLIWRKELRLLQIPFIQRNDVHDEWQTQTPREFAEKLAEVQKQAIVQVGLDLNLRVALAGTHKIGLNWKETH